MKPRSVFFSLCLSVFALIFLAIVGCGGGGGGDSAPAAPTSADLSLTKAVDIPTPIIDTDVVFTITVANAGPIDATGVIVTDKLPSGFIYVSDTSGGAYDPVTGAWSVGGVAVGTSLSLNVTATVKLTGNYLNIAEVTAADQPDPDSRPGNGVPNEDDFASATAAPPSINVSINQIQTDCQTNPGSTDVTAFVTVTDQIGDPVTTLTSNDFTLWENQTGIPAFDVEFAEQIPIPLSVSIIMDYSTSIFDSGIITEVENAVVTFINLMSAVDRAEIIKFNQLPIQVAINFTSDKAALINAINTPFGSAAQTELYEATLRGVNDLYSEPGTNRKAVIVITDGRNNSDVNTTVGNVITAAKANNVPIFAIAIGSGINLGDLTRLTGETGGILYQSTDKQTIEEIYQQLADALIINQFVFTYNTSLTGGAPATLEIEAEFNLLTDSDSRQFTTCP